MKILSIDHEEILVHTAQHYDPEMLVGNMMLDGFSVNIDEY